MLSQNATVNEEITIDDELSSFDDDFEGDITINQNYLDTNNGGDTFATLNLQTATNGKVVITGQDSDIIYQKGLNAGNFYQSADGFSYDILVGDVDLSDVNGIQFLNFSFYDSNDNSLIQEVYQIDKNKNQFVMYPAVYIEIYDGIISEDTEGPIVVVYAELNYLTYRSLWISDSEYTFGFYPENLNKLTYYDHGIYSKNHVDGWAYYGITAARLMNMENFSSNLNGNTLSFVAYKMNYGLPQDRLAYDERSITFTDGGFYLGDEGNNEEQEPTLILEVYGNEYMPIDYDDGIVFSIIISGDDKTGSWKPIDELSYVRLRVASDNGNEFLNVNLNDLFYSDVPYSPGIIEHMFTLSELNDFEGLNDGDSIRFYLEVPPYPEDSVEYTIYFEEDAIYLNFENNEDDPEDYNLTFGEYHRFNQEIVKGRGTYDASFEFPFSAEGSVTVYVDDKYYGVEEVEYGDAFIEVDTSNLTLGKHNVRFEYSGDDSFKPSTAYDSFNVTYIEFIVPTTIRENTGMSATTAVVALPFDATGKAKLIVDGVEKATEQIVEDDGSAFFSLLDLPYGNHSVTLTYQGNYPSASKTVNVESFIVSQVAPILSVSADDINVGEKAIINVLMNGGLNGNVLVNVNNVNYTVNIVNGKGSLSVSGLARGTYDVTVTFAGDVNYLPSMNSTKFTVNKISTSISAVYDAATKEITATLTNGATGKAIANTNVKFSLNGVTTTVKTNSNGKAKLSTADLPSGTYTATISYAGNSKYKSSKTTVDIATSKVDSSISAVYDEANKLITATLTNVATGKAIANINVKVSFNGETNTLKTNTKGQVKVSTEGLTLGTYPATFSYAGNSKYNPASTSINVEVKTKVIVTDVYAYSDRIVAKLTNGATGKAIANANMIVEINGVKYNAKSDNKGQLTFDTTGLNLPSAFDLTISYRGNDRYTASSATVAVDLNKANMMITTNYHADKQKMVATLKNSKTGKIVSNANMIIELNGVKTTYKSNDQGKITLPTADFAPGTYVGTVTYPGNARYNSISAVFSIIFQFCKFRIILANLVKIFGDDFSMQSYNPY